MNLFEELINAVAAAREDAEKFYNKGNAAAGRRLRIALQDIKTKAQAIRLDVSAKKKAS